MQLFFCRFSRMRRGGGRLPGYIFPEIFWSATKDQQVASFRPFFPFLSFFPPCTNIFRSWQSIITSPTIPIIRNRNILCLTVYIPSQHINQHINLNMCRADGPMTKWQVHQRSHLLSNLAAPNTSWSQSGIGLYRMERVSLKAKNLKSSNLHQNTTTCGPCTSS